MICPNCGREGRGKFCTNCGSVLDQPAPSSGQGAPQGFDANATSRMPPGGVAGAQPGMSGGADDASTQRFAPSGIEPPPQRPSYGPLQGSMPSMHSGPAEDTYGGSGWSDASWQRPAPSAYGGPGEMTMQPMTLGQVLSGTFSILQSRLMQFLGVAVAYTVAMFAALVIFGIVAAASVATLVTGGIGSALGGFVLGVIILIVVGVVAGAVAACAYINIARGNEPMVGRDLVGATIATLQRAWKDAPGLLLAYLVLAGLWLGLWIVTALIAAILGQVVGALAFLVSLAAFVVFIWLGVSLVFVPQAAVIEKAGATGSLSRSMHLVSGYWWRTLGYLLVAVGVSIGFYIVGAIVIAILSVILSHIPVLGGLIDSLLQAAVIAIVYAFSITYLTLMFFDVKARKAGMAQAAAPAPGF